MRDHMRLVYLSARLVGGRWFWMLPLLPLLWPAWLMIRLLAGWRQEAYVPAEVQNGIIGLPLAGLAVLLGVRIIAGEIDNRTLEIAYTVPGGARRVWISKLVGAGVMLLTAELLLALVTAVFLSGVPIGVLYVPLQAAAFYLVLSMALSALFRSEVTGALATIPFLVLGLVPTQTRPSPFFNTLRSSIADGADPSDILAWTLQNRIGFALLILAIGALAFARAERREQMMSG